MVGWIQEILDVVEPPNNPAAPEQLSLVGYDSKVICGG
jgi:hypothetical protein